VAKVLKKLLAGQILDATKGVDGAVFVNVAPMTVEKSTRFRGFLRQKAGGAHLRILHNRTARQAFKEAGWPKKLADVLKGPTAMIYGGSGATGIAKSLGEWIRQDKTFVVKGAIAEGEFYDAKSVTTTLAKMPDKQTLRAMLLGAISAPARGLAVAIGASGAGLARVTKARIDKQGFAADAAS
jgi:large subunit ribosomal protein L10